MKLSAVLSRVRWFGPSLLIYVCGATAFVVVDAIIARLASREVIAEWVALKALVLIAGSVATTGLDGVIVREPREAPRLARWAVVHALAVSTAAAAAAKLTGYFHNLLPAFLAIAGLAGTMIAFSWLRTHLRLTRAQIARDGWKAVLLVLLWPLHFWLGVPLEWVLVTSVMTGIGLAMVGGWGVPAEPVRQVHQEVKHYRSAMAAAFPFLLAAGALGLASYGELLLVRAFGTADEMALYFRALIVFGYPSLVLSSYLGAVLTVQMRVAPERWSRLMRQFSTWLAVVVVAAPIASATLGYLLAPLLFPGVSFPIWLAVLISATAGIRLVYAAVTSFISALATAPQLQRTTNLYFIVAVATVPASAGLIWAGVEVIPAIAIVALLHWAFRMGIGGRLASNIAEVFHPGPRTTQASLQVEGPRDPLQGPD